MKDKLIEGIFLVIMLGFLWFVIGLALNIGVDQQVCRTVSYQEFMQLHCQEVGGFK